MLYFPTSDVKVCVSINKRIDGSPAGDALLSDVPAWHLADRAGGHGGQSDAGSKAERSSAAECVSGKF